MNHGKNVVNGHYIPLKSRTMKPLSNAWSGMGRGQEGEMVGQSNQCTIYAYLEMSQWIYPVQWIYPNKNIKNSIKIWDNWKLYPYIWVSKHIFYIYSQLKETVKIKFFWTKEISLRVAMQLWY
jgi:hypothetical protein